MGVLIASLCLGPLTAAHAQTMAFQKHPIIVVTGPTVIAFFGQPSETGLMTGARYKASSNFHLHAAHARKAFTNLGIAFHELYTDSFGLRTGNLLLIFHPGKAGGGYYLIAPGLKPCIEYGILSDADLLQLAKRYFGQPGK
jgi:hypothetical protein